MSRQNWLCLEPTCNSSYKSHTAEWRLKNWSLILLSGRALPALSRVWGRSRSQGLPKCAKMHLCQQLWHQLGGEARLCPASGDLPLGPCAGDKWPSDNGVFKEVSQSQVDWEQGIIVEELTSLFHAKKWEDFGVSKQESSDENSQELLLRWSSKPCLTQGALQW